MRVLQHTVLMDARRVSESIPPHNRLVGLYRHIHQTGNHTAGGIYFAGIDIRPDIYFMMTLHDHRYFLERGISRTFADTIDCYLHLPRSDRKSTRLNSSH